MPAPKHITDKMSSILAETPDRALSRGDSSEKLRAIGLDWKSLSNCRWSDEDAVTFAIDTKYHVAMWMANSAEDRAYQHSDFDDFFTGGYRDTKANKGVVGMDWKKYRQLAVWHRGKFNSGDRADTTMLMGRLWRKSNFVSFWNPKDDVMKEWKVLVDFITNMKMSPKQCVYEFIDKMEIETYDEALGKTGGHQEVDPETMRKMHTSPELKKSILGTDSTKKQSAMDQFYARQSDGVIKLGSLLKEDPDTMGWVAPKEEVEKMSKLGVDSARLSKYQLWHDQFDAVPFMYDFQSDVITFSVQDGDASKMVHDDLTSVAAMFANDPSMFSVEKKSYGWTITPKYDDPKWENVEEIDVQIGPISFTNLSSDSEVLKYIENEYPVLGHPSRENSRYLQGRLWRKVPAVSYWSDAKRVIETKALTATVKLLQALEIDPRKTMYEFLDHDKTFFYDELGTAGESTMSREEYLELMRKQHLDSKAKRELNKDAEYIDKFGGMLPAAYHAAKQTSDGIIKLGDLLK